MKKKTNKESVKEDIVRYHGADMTYADLSDEAFRYCTDRFDHDRTFVPGWDSGWHDGYGDPALLDEEFEKFDQGYCAHNNYDVGPVDYYVQAYVTATIIKNGYNPPFNPSDECFNEWTSKFKNIVIESKKPTSKKKVNEAGASFGETFAMSEAEFGKWLQATKGMTALEVYNEPEIGCTLVYIKDSKALGGIRHIGTYNHDRQVLFCDDVSFFGRVIESGKNMKKKVNESADYPVEDYYNQWIKERGTDVSNADAYFAGAKKAGCTADDSDYECWIEKSAPSYDVSNYDAFEAGFYEALQYADECAEAGDEDEEFAEPYDYHHPNYGIDDCSCCGSPDGTSTLESFLKNDGYPVDEACDILDMDPAEIVCPECYKSWRSELDSKFYSEYNDLGIDTRTGEEWGKYEESKSSFKGFNKQLRAIRESKENEITDFTPKASSSWKGAKKGWLAEGGYVSFTNHIGERDSFYDPNKKEPTLAELDAQAGGDSYASVNWLGRFEKGIDYSTKEGLEKAANRWWSDYTSDLVHDIQHDGDYQGAKDCSKALSQFYSKIMSSAESLGLTSKDANGPLKDILQQSEKRAKNKASAEKRAATKAANQANRLADYQQKALATTNETLRALLNDDGTLKARNSWGTIKDHLSTEEGKIFKNLWVNQFK